MERKRNKKRELLILHRIGKRMALTVIAVLILTVVYECRTKAIVAEATGELIPIYFKENEVIYGEELKEPDELNDFSYEKTMEPFEPVDCPLDYELQEYTWLMCKANNIDFSLVMALMQHESRYDAKVISPTDDYGLMQINETNHKWLSDELGITDYLDEKQNINAGVYVLRLLFEKYDDTSQVLMAYNMGESNAKECWDYGIYESEYSRQILQYQAEIKEELEKAK